MRAFVWGSYSQKSEINFREFRGETGKRETEKKKQRNNATQDGQKRRRLTYLVGKWVGKDARPPPRLRAHKHEQIRAYSVTATRRAVGAPSGAP